MSLTVCPLVLCQHRSSVLEAAAEDCDSGHLLSPCPLLGTPLPTAQQAGCEN